mmetsp:Transcript_12414/g.28733  ORF Transcript_12414/g.28733 Transcript_12414/m.28733 type:complete len:469 (-) Transcript_12414:165-1571(-)
MTRELGKMVFPCMSVWAKTRRRIGGERTQLLLDRYIEEYLAGNENATDLSVAYFNVAMDAWVRSGLRDAPTRVKRLLDRMKQLRGSRPHDLRNLSPDVISFSTWILSLGRCRTPFAAKQAQVILQYLEENNMAPNTLTYNAVLLCLVHENSLDKAIRAQEIVDRMEMRYQAGHKECRPDVCSYQSIMAAWSRTASAGTPQKVEEILAFLDQESKNGRKDLTPNIHCYAAAIHAWRFSDERNRARRAYEIFQNVRRRAMEDNDPNLLPNVVTCTAVINACAYPRHHSERKDALEIARLVWDELEYCDYGKPNFMTYAAFLGVIATTLHPNDPRRDEMACRTFRRCCNYGLVGRNVLEKFVHAASPELFQLLLGDYVTTKKEWKRLDIPENWKRNVRGEVHRRNEDDAFGEELPLTQVDRDRLSRIRELTGGIGPYSRRRDDSENCEDNDDEQLENRDSNWPLFKSIRPD